MKKKLMKTITAICLSLCLLFHSQAAFAGGDGQQGENVKYATIYVLIDGKLPSILVIWDGQSKKVKLDENFFTHNEESNRIGFTAIHTEMEELGKKGYVLSNTSAMVTSGVILMYTLIKEE
ncbi:MAG: hypothetical protein SFW35_01180 [Chitinophagales bacterium]|nr:hypothetical protein [Chitinophagales bacterium]